MGDGFAEILDLLARICRGWSNYELILARLRVSRVQDCFDFRDSRVVRVIDDEDNLVFRIVEFEQRRQIISKPLVEVFARGNDRGERCERTGLFCQLLSKISEIRDPAEERAEAEIDEERAEEEEEKKHETQV